MSLTTDLHELLRGTGVGELNFLILCAMAILTGCAVVPKALTMRVRVTLMALAATIFGTAFVVEDQILRYEDAWGFMREPVTRVTFDKSDYMALLPISTVIGAIVVALACMITAVFVVKLTKKGSRMPVITGCAIIIAAALSITARAVYFHLPMNTLEEVVMGYAWIYLRDLTALCIIPFAVACVVNLYRLYYPAAAATPTDGERTAGRTKMAAGDTTV